MWCGGEVEKEELSWMLEIFPMIQLYLNSVPFSLPTTFRSFLFFLCLSLLYPISPSFPARDVPAQVALLVAPFSHPRTPQSLVSDIVGFGKPEM